MRLILLGIPVLFTVILIPIFWFFLNQKETANFERTDDVWILFNLAVYLTSSVEKAQTDLSLLRKFCADLALMGKKIEIFPFEGAGVKAAKRVSQFEEAETINLDWHFGTKTNISKAILWSQSAKPEEIFLVFWIPGKYAYRSEEEAEKDVEISTKLLKYSGETIFFDQHELFGNETMIVHEIEDVLLAIGKTTKRYETARKTTETSNAAESIPTKGTDERWTNQKTESTIRLTPSNKETTPMPVETTKILTESSTQKTELPWTGTTIIPSESTRASEFSTEIVVLSTENPKETSTPITTEIRIETTPSTAIHQISTEIPIISTERLITTDFSTESSFTEPVTEIIHFTEEVPWTTEAPMITAEQFSHISSEKSTISTITRSQFSTEKSGVTFETITDRSSQFSTEEHTELTTDPTTSLTTKITQFELTTESDLLSTEVIAISSKVTDQAELRARSTKENLFITVWSIPTDKTTGQFSSEGSPTTEEITARPSVITEEFSRESSTEEMTSEKPFVETTSKIENFSSEGSTTVEFSTESVEISEETTGFSSEMTTDKSTKTTAQSEFTGYSTERPQITKDTEEITSKDPRTTVEFNTESSWTGQTTEESTQQITKKDEITISEGTTEPLQRISPKEVPLNDPVISLLLAS